MGWKAMFGGGGMSMNINEDTKACKEMSDMSAKIGKKCGSYKIENTLGQPICEVCGKPAGNCVLTFSTGKKHWVCSEHVLNV